LRAADQVEMDGESKADGANREQPQQRTGDYLKRSVAAQPPYLVT
jgi:hypothetical protein